jgi:methyl-accepting chemotaxis protein
LGHRVWLGVGALLAILAASLILAILLVRGLANDEHVLSDRSYSYSTAVASAALAAKGVANDERGFLLSGDRAFIAEANRRIARVRGRLTAATSADSGAAERRAISAARAGFERWVSAIRRGFAAYQAGDRTGPVSASLGRDRALRKRYEAALDHALALGASAARSADASVAAASSRSVAILLGCLIGALALGLGVAYWLVRSIAVPVARLLSILGGADRLRALP